VCVCVCVYFNWFVLQMFLNFLSIKTQPKYPLNYFLNIWGLQRDSMLYMMLHIDSKMITVERQINISRHKATFLCVTREAKIYLFNKFP
jgi:hypothetical protein